MRNFWGKKDIYKTIAQFDHPSIQQNYKVRKDVPNKNNN